MSEIICNVAVKSLYSSTLLVANLIAALFTKNGLGDYSVDILKFLNFLKQLPPPKLSTH
jgi:hypothetical protein